MSTYSHDSDKKSGDGLALTEWNDLSSAVAGNSGLTLALNPADQIGIGTNNPAAKLSIKGSGKESGPDSDMHITDDCILFGGNNNGKQVDSAQISAGKHVQNSLNIVGMASNTNQNTRKIDAWAEGGFTIRGDVGIGKSPSEKLEVDGNVKATKFIGDGSGLTNLSVGAAGVNLATTGDSRVGIGTDNPKAKLHVEGGAIMPSAGNSENDGILFPKDPGGGSGDSAWIRYYPRHGEATTLELGVNNDNGDHIALMPSGNVGIGINEPTHKFHVKSSAAVGLFESTDNQAYLRLSTSDGIDKRVEFCNRPGGRAAIWVSDSGDAFNVLANGSVGIGTNNPRNTLEVAGTLRLSGSNNYSRMYLKSDKLVFRIQSSTHGSNKAMSWDGDSNWDSYSDQKLKTDIEEEKNILDRLVKLNVVNYQWKDAPKKENKSIGFIAQDVEPLFPSLVGEIEDPDTNETSKTLKYANFGVLAVGAIKEMKQEYDKQIAELKKEIAGLKEMLAAR